MSKYSATLYDCKGISESDRMDAEQAYCAAVDGLLGERAADAYAAYLSIVNKYEGTPLPASADNAERAAVQRWEEADNAGHDAAFAGWHSVPDSAHFEITVA